MKKKFIFSLSLCVCLWVLSVGAEDQNKTSSEQKIQETQKADLSTPDASYWNKMADGTVQALIKNFWGASFPGHPRRYYFNYRSHQEDMSTNHYWQQAHAMDVLVDAWLRTGDQQYLQFYPLWWEGAPRFNFAGRPEDRWWNDFVDDMEWIALAQTRMYSSSGERAYIFKARELFDTWIWPTWGPEEEAPWHGGITWKTDVAKSKNACSNGPAAILAARLYRFYDEAKLGEQQGAKPRTEYLEKSLKIYHWLKNKLFDPKTGEVFDNLNRRGEVGRAVYTYNQGTFLGAAHELYQITGQKQYLEDAVKAADWVVEHMSNHNGTLSDSTRGDGGLFHGIFFRYFVILANEKGLDWDIRQKYHNYITRMAGVMAKEGINPRTMLYSGRWHSAPKDDESVALTAHLTGCMLMEAMCVLEPLPEKEKAQ